MPSVNSVGARLHGLWPWGRILRVEFLAGEILPVEFAEFWGRIRTIR